jgi:DNA-binding NarL/FixJ family response regulator
MLSSMEERDTSLEVLVSDADEITVKLLAADLRRHCQFDVSECPAGHAQLVSSISNRNPSILLLGLRARDSIADFFALLRGIHSEFPWIRTIILSGETGRDMVQEIFRAGAKGFVDRSQYDPALLSRCVQCVASGQVWATSEQLLFVLEAFASTMALQSSKGLEALTPREREVAELVGNGLGNGEVARRLGLSIHTVKNYLFSIFDKTGVSNRAELILYLVSNNAPSKKSTVATVERQQKWLPKSESSSTTASSRSLSVTAKRMLLV